jgi:hypothetical protein
LKPIWRDVRFGLEIESSILRVESPEAFLLIVKPEDTWRPD